MDNEVKKAPVECESTKTQVEIDDEQYITVLKVGQVFMRAIYVDSVGFKCDGDTYFPHAEFSNNYKGAELRVTRSTCTEPRKLVQESIQAFYGQDEFVDTLDDMLDKLDALEVERRIVYGVKYDE